VTEEKSVQRVTVKSVPLSGDPPDASAAPREFGDVDPPTRFKYQQLAMVVMDVPWETGLMWADGHADLDDVPKAERDQVIRDVVLELFDEGLVYYFEIEDFGDSYSRTPSPEEHLSREQLVEAISGGGEVTVNGVSAPFLGVRATEKGLEAHFSRFPEDRAR
jgi:hypothetical protein